MSKTILLADDSLTIQKVIELTFSDTDFELRSVGNGVDALEALKRYRPDLVLADVVMPGKNGYEVCEAIKQDPALSSIPVVLLSGTFEPFDRGRAEQARADAVVTKPFDSKNLLAQVESLLRGPRAGPSEAPAAGAAGKAGVAFEEPPPPSRAPIDPVFGSFAEREDALEMTSSHLRLGQGSDSPAPPEPPPRAEALEFDLDDTSPFGDLSKAESPGTRPPAAASREDNVFDFPAGSENASPSPERAAPMLPEASATSAEPLAGSPEFLPEEGSPADTSAAEALPDIERLAQTASISDLASLVSRMSASSALSDEDAARIARLAVAQVSEKVIREIAWEVVPELAELLIRRRIRELEAEGAESPD